MPGPGMGGPGMGRGPGMGGPGMGRGGHRPPPPPPRRYRRGCMPGCLVYVLAGLSVLGALIGALIAVF